MKGSKKHGDVALGEMDSGHGGNRLGVGLGISKVFSNLVGPGIPYPPRGHGPAVGVGAAEAQLGTAVMGWRQGHGNTGPGAGSPGCGLPKSHHGLKGAAPIPNWMEKVCRGGNSSHSWQINALSCVHPLGTANHQPR